MKHARKDLKVEGAVELPHVVAYLEQLVQALKAGTVRVRQGDQEIVLGPRGVVGFALSASEKGKRQNLSLELTWRKFSAPEEDLELRIDAAPAEVNDAAPDVIEATSPATITGDDPAAAEARGEAHEGELHAADVYMHNPRGGNNRPNEA
jgi:amphi-Trp domain-containing protein